MLFQGRTAKSKHANVYRFARQYIFATCVQVRKGPTTEVDWVALPLTATDVDLGTTACTALNQYREVARAPTSGTSYREAIASRAGVPISSLILSKALLVDLHEEDKLVRVTPWRNGENSGENRGHHELIEGIVTVESSSAEKVGQAMKQCFERLKVQKSSGVEQ